MNIHQFAAETNLIEKTELDKACMLAFFHLKTEGSGEFSTKNVATWFRQLHLPLPNESRMRGNLGRSTKVTAGKGRGMFRLHAKEIGRLQTLYPDVGQKSEEIFSGDTVLPQELYLSTRGYIERLCKQINASYERNIFDGCAVLMRRLMEVLLILCCQHTGTVQQILDNDGRFIGLEKIIDRVQQNGVINLSLGVKKTLDIFRQLGNFSAHSIHYTAKRSDISNVALDYRVAIEELLYKSGLKT